MPIAVISPKFQIVIPKEIRERLDLKPGQQVAFVERNGLVTMVPAAAAERAPRHPQRRGHQRVSRRDRPVLTPCRTSSTRRSGSSTWPTDPLAADAAPYLEPPEDVITPSVVVYEVYRWARREGGDPPAMEAVAHMEHTRIVPADAAAAIVAAEVGAEKGLAAVDAFVYGTARLAGVRPGDARRRLPWPARRQADRG